MSSNQKIGNRINSSSPTPTTTQKIYTYRISPPSRIPNRLGNNKRDTNRLEGNEISLSPLLQRRRNNSSSLDWGPTYQRPNRRAENAIETKTNPHDRCLRRSETDPTNRSTSPMQRASNRKQFSRIPQVR